MRKIDKSKILAVKYNAALRDYAQDNEGHHPKFSNSSFRDRHYQDVYMNLLFCQKGLCAYTESLICSAEDDVFQEEVWVNGEYEGALETRELEGNIDHFDPSLKEENGWEWNNLFVVLSSINQKVKHKNIVPNYLKPDQRGYDPYNYLRYNFSSHRFVPNPQLDKDSTEDVWKMIRNLGLNFHTIKERRKKLLNEKALYIGEGLKDFDSVYTTEISEFFTAFEMSRDEIERFDFNKIEKEQ